MGSSWVFVSFKLIAYALVYVVEVKGVDQGLRRTVMLRRDLDSKLVRRRGLQRHSVLCLGALQCVLKFDSAGSGPAVRFAVSRMEGLFASLERLHEAEIAC